MDGSGSERSPSKAQALSSIALPEAEAEAAAGVGAEASSSSSLPASAPGFVSGSEMDDDMIDEKFAKVWQMGQQEDEQLEQLEEEQQLALQAFVQASSPRAEAGASLPLPYTPCLVPVPVPATFDDTAVEKEELALQQWDREEKERERRQSEQQEQNQQNQREQERLEQHQEIQGFFQEAMYGMEYDTPLPPAAPAKMQHVQNLLTPTQPTPTQSLPDQYGFTLNTNTPAVYYHPGQNIQAQIAPSYNPPAGQAVSVAGRAAAPVPASTKLATTSNKSVKKQEARRRLRKTPESERRDRDIPCKKCATAMAKNDLARGCIDEVRGGRIACTVKKGEASDARCLECTYEARTCEPVSCCFPFVPSSLQT